MRQTIILLILLLLAPTSRAATARYVFLMIGDGMGKHHRAAATRYLRETTHKDDAVLTMDALPVHGQTDTADSDGAVTDSAAAGTALATGHKTRSGRIAMDAAGKTALPTLAERAHAKGLKIAIISSVSLDHATPACFYAHVRSRSDYSAISRALLDAKVDFFGGGGLLGAQNEDGTDNLHLAAGRGLTLIRTRKALAAAQPGKRIYAFNHRLDDLAALPFAIDARPDDLTLAEFLTHAIRLLDGPAGFFIMVEGGKIDWAAHDNDLKTLLPEIIAFDEAIAVAKAFVDKRLDDALLVVTADHETGDLQPTAAADDAPTLKAYDFNSRGHTGAAVPTSALGTGADRFKGKTDNTDIAKRIAELMGL